MTKFIDLSLQDQATIVLISVLEDVATEKRTLQGLEHHIHALYNIVFKKYDVPDQEVNLIVDAVASKGVEMLPGFENDGG